MRAVQCTKSKVWNDFSAFVFVNAISFRKWIRRFVCTAAVASVDKILRISVLAKGEAPTSV